MEIHLIIQQLLKDSLPEDIWAESDDKIERLTPIIKVGGGESTASEPKNSFYVGTATDVMPTLIVSEELYPFYLDHNHWVYMVCELKILIDIISESLYLKFPMDLTNYLNMLI